MCRRLALLSFHGCPVARLGEKDTGGMNVYVLQLAREFAARGYRVDVFTRHHDPQDPRIVELEDGARVVHLDAGPYDAAKQDLFNYIPRFIKRTARVPAVRTPRLRHHPQPLLAVRQGGHDPQFSLARPARDHLPHPRQDQAESAFRRARVAAAPGRRGARHILRRRHSRIHRGGEARRPSPFTAPIHARSRSFRRA